MDAFAAQVQEAEFQAQVFRTVLVAWNVEWRLIGISLDLAFIRDNFNLAGRKIRINGGGLARDNFPGYGDDAFQLGAAQRLEKITAGMNDHLGEAVMIAEVNKQDAAVIAHAEYPPGEPRGGASVACAQLAACVGSVKMHVGRP